METTLRPRPFPNRGLTCIPTPSRTTIHAEIGELLAYRSAILAITHLMPFFRFLYFVTVANFPTIADILSSFTSVHLISLVDPRPALPFIFKQTTQHH